MGNESQNKGVFSAWLPALAIVDAPAVDEALRIYAEDQTGDNATAIVAAVLEAASGATELPRPLGYMHHTSAQKLMGGPQAVYCQISREPASGHDCAIYTWLDLANVRTATAKATGLDLEHTDWSNLEQALCCLGIAAETPEVLAASPTRAVRELINGVLRLKGKQRGSAGPAPERPDCFEFALEFLGEPEAEKLRTYVEQLEAAQPAPAVDVVRRAAAGAREVFAQSCSGAGDAIGYMEQVLLVALDAGRLAGTTDQHPDDAAVDAFAAALKEKLARSRAKGRGGWADPSAVSVIELARQLMEHTAKGDPIDVAAFAMMLHQRGAGHHVLADAAREVTLSLLVELKGRVRDMQYRVERPGGESNHYLLRGDVLALIERAEEVESRGASVGELGSLGHDLRMGRAVRIAADRHSLKRWRRVVHRWNEQAMTAGFDGVDDALRSLAPASAGTSAQPNTTPADGEGQQPLRMAISTALQLLAWIANQPRLHVETWCKPGGVVESSVWGALDREDEEPTGKAATVIEALLLAKANDEARNG